MSLAPPFATITGSKIIFLVLIFFNPRITFFIISSECNMPILTASGLISLAVKRIWLRISFAGMETIDFTPVVF